MNVFPITHDHWQRRFNVFSIYIDVRKSRYAIPAAYEVSNTRAIFCTGWPNHERSSSAMMIHLVLSQIRSLRCFSDCPSKLYSVPSGLRCIVAAFCAVLSYSSYKNYLVFRTQMYLKCCCISVDHGRQSLCILNYSVHSIQNFIQSSQRWPRRRQKIAA